MNISRKKLEAIAIAPPARSRISRGPLIVLALLAAVIYIGIAMWGWGGWAGFFANPPRAAICAALVALAGLTPLCGCNVSTGLQEDASNNWIFPPLLLFGLLMGWIGGYSDRHNVWTFGGDVIRYVGVALFLIGSGFRIGAMRTLGPRFTVWVAIQEGHTLQTTGLYRVIRHPSYTGVFCALFGWAMVFRSSLAMLLAAMMLPIMITRMAAEERLLMREFSQYAAYQKRTWRLLPGVY